MLHEKILKFFAKHIEDELGIVYAEHNFFQLENRLEEIAKLLEQDGLGSLYLLAQHGINGQFKQLLLDLATNNETSFFRDPKVFKTVETVVLAKVRELCAPGERLRIWSAASSTGQEALSLAIMIKEFNAKNKTEIDFQITATDISERVLAQAKSGLYTQLEAQRGLPAPYLIKYFKTEGDNKWAASPHLLSHMVFDTVNLKTSFGFHEKFHMVFCRNVLIYQNIESKKDILERIASAMVPGGYLVLGSGESLLGLAENFDQILVDGAILYRKSDAKSQAA